MYLRTCSCIVYTYIPKVHVRSFFENARAYCTLRLKIRIVEKKKQLIVSREWNVYASIHRV